MDDMPSTIQIGPIRFRVVVTPEAYNARVVATDQHFWGHIDYKEAVIELDPQQHPDHLRWALFHEVLHGCWHVAEPEGTAFSEEQAIRTLAGVLLDTLRRNPDLVMYLLMDVQDSTARRARLAEYAHAAWAGWMRYLFEKSMQHADGSMTIPAPLVARWQRQIATAYADLPPDEQASDLAEADRIMALL